MNFLKNILRMAMVAVAAIAVTACEQNDEAGNSSLILSVVVENITATSAKIKVSHNGKTADSWYGLLTTDTSTREDRLIADAVAELRKGDIGSQLIFSKSYVKILTPLSPKTTYRYIAFGLTEEGEVYGERASVEFQTLEQGGNSGNGDNGDEVYDRMLPNPAWSIAYTGAGTIDGKAYKHTVSVNSTDKNPYTIAVIYASEYDPSNPSALRELGEQLVESMKEYLVAYNNSYGTSFVLNDLLYRGSGATAFDNLNPGYYIALAIGITAKGEVSGLYAVAPEVFHIEEEAATSLYASWLGDWVLKGDNNISNEVIIGRNVANKSVNLYGLQGLPFAVVGEYSTERNDIIFSSQVVESNYEFSGGQVGDIHLLGIDNEGNTYKLDEGSYAIAIAGVLDNGYRAIVRYGLYEPGYPKFVAMFLTAKVGNSYYDLGQNIPSFNGIAELAPATTTSAVSSKRFAFGKTPAFEQSRALRLGRKIEVVEFSR